MIKRQAHLEALVTSAVESLGFKLWGYECIKQGRRILLRVYIDTLDESPIEAPSRITVEDCGLASRQINALLDKDAIFVGTYCLEVSSPGESRPLMTLAHYHFAVDKTVRIRLSEPILGRRQYRGVVSAVEKDAVILRVDGGGDGACLSIPYHLINRGNLMSVY